MLKVYSGSAIRLHSVMSGSESIDVMFLSERGFCTKTKKFTVLRLGFFGLSCPGLP